MALLTMALATMALLTTFYLLLTTYVELLSLQPTAKPTADDRLEFVDPVQSAPPQP